MNVAGLPGLGDSSAFWWVMLTMAVVPAVFLLAIRWRGRGWANPARSRSRRKPA